MTLQFVPGESCDYSAIEEIYRQAFPRYVLAVGRDLLSDPRGELESYRREENLWLARDRGVAKLSLHTTQIMTGLVRLYQQQGYRIVRQGLPEHGLDDYQRVFMEKRIQI